MEQWEFLMQEAIRTPEQEVEIARKVRAVFTENTRLHEENAELKDENAVLKERLAWFEKQIYGRKTEKTEVVLEEAEQLALFNEAEEEAEIRPQEAGKIDVQPHQRKKKRGHDELMSELAVEEVVHEVEEKTCEKCGSEMTVIGKEKIRDELVYIPARVFVRRHYAQVVKCTACGMDESRDAQLPDIEKNCIRQAEVPPPMIEHSFCSPELLAHIIYEKYCNAVPLYRQEKDFAAKGVVLSRTTMANWIICAAQLWIKPVWEQMKKELLASTVIHADETTVQVLHEKDRKAKTESRMWVYCAGKREGHSNILFEYQPTRNGDHAARFLGEYSGYLVCDGFDGYNKLSRVRRCGCWAHVRRKFVEALPGEPELLPTSAAAVGVEYCNRLYQADRAAEAGSIVNEFFAWLESVNAAPRTKLAAAVQYARNEKKYLCRFLESEEIPLDNNRAENAVRPLCIGRKNWLFSVSPKGAQASAMLYSVSATACANGKNVEEYLTQLLRRPAGTVKLPW